MKADTSLASLAEARVKRHGRTYIAVKSRYYATNYEHVHIAYNPVITLNPIRFLRPYHYRLIEIIRRSVPGVRMVLRVNRD